MIDLCTSMAGLGSSRVATPVGEWNAAMCPGLMFCAAMLSVYWSCLFHDEHWRYVSVKGRPGVILGSPCSLFSESTGLVFHTCVFSVEILISCVSLQRVTARDS